MRLYGHNNEPRASSNSSTGPKWTSSISDLLINRNNTMRFNNQGIGASQSHQTSQNQLLTQPQFSQQQHQHSTIQQQQQQPPGSAGNGDPSGGRLMMKLMNIGSNAGIHQPSSSVGTAHTFDHPRLSGSRDDQKRLALDECTNYLQQKTQQQHPQFPSTQLAINNIINSNRSASSTGLQVPGSQQMQQISSSTSNAAKKYQAFKFNLTLKALNQQKGVDQQNIQQQQQQQVLQQPQFYNQPSNEVPENQDNEDTDAIVINEKHRKQMQGMSRGPSQLAMKQHLKQMIKSYEDQPAPSQYQEHEQQQLTYDNTQNQAPQRQQSSSKSGATVKPLDKKVSEMEERQKIFEEEIIKRVKEIQNYTKTLHMHLKKLQQSQSKKGEEIQANKDQIMQIKEMVGGGKEQSNGRINEHEIHDIVDKRIQLLDGSISHQCEALELKLVKDYDNKFLRISKQSQNDIQIKSEALKEEILGMVSEELTTNFKSEIMKQVGERVKEAGKVYERGINEMREVLKEQSQQIEDVIAEQQAMTKDANSKQEKTAKSMKELKISSDDTVNALGESLRLEIESMRKKMLKDLRSEIDQKNNTIQSELQDQISELAIDIQAIQGQMSSKLQESGSSQQKDSMINQRIDELEKNLKSQLSVIDNNIQTINQKAQASDDKLKSISEAYLQLKSHQASQASMLDNRTSQIESSLSDLHEHTEQTSNDLRNELQHLKIQLDHIQSQTPNHDDIDQAQITENVLEQIQPELQGISESHAQMQQQIDQLKQQLSQKLMRSELQEIKQDIDDEIKSIEKVIKKQDDRVQGVENVYTGLRSQMSQLESDVNSHISDIQGRISSDKSAIEVRTKQISDDLQSKTNDLNEEIQELSDKVGKSQGQQVQASSETSPERRSRLEAMAALKSSLESNIDETNQRFEELHLFQNNIQQSQSLYRKSQEDQLKTLRTDLEAMIKLSSQPIDKQLQTFQQKVETSQATNDEQFDDIISKVNELDSRINQIEEKDLKTVVTEEQDDKLHVNHEEIQALQAQIEELQQQVAGKFESLVIHSKEIDSLKADLKKLSTNQSSNENAQKDSLQQLEYEIKQLHELNACLQDVSLTHDEFTKYRADSNKQLEDRLKSVLIANDKLQTQIDDLKQHKEACIKNSSKLDDHEHKIETLEEQIKNQPRDQSLNRIEESKELTHEVLKRKSLPQVGNSGKAIRSKNQLIATPIRGYENESPQQIQRQHQGHFLEDLSEAVLSPNHLGGADGDMMIFNNRQSMSSASMMSNRMMTPIQQRGVPPFQFNSQLAGRQQPRLDASPDQHHEEEEQKKKTPSTQKKQQNHDGIVSAMSSPQHNNSPPSNKQRSIEALPQRSSFEESPRQITPVVVNHELTEEEEDEPMQEMNISLESAREEEKSHDTKSNVSPPQQRSIQLSSNKLLSHKKALESTPPHLKSASIKSRSSPHYNEEQAPSVEDHHVDEVLGSSQNLSDDGREEPSYRQESEEGKDGEPDMHLPQAVQFENEEDHPQQEDSQPHMLSPNHQIQQQQQVHHPNHLGSAHPHINQQQQQQQQQNPHFVAFESDEEDSQQYDLLPIGNQSPRRGGTSTAHVLAPPIQNHQSAIVNNSGGQAAANPQMNSRNRYYESGSGGEEEEEPEEHPFQSEPQNNSLQAVQVGFAPQQPQPLINQSLNPHLNNDQDDQEDNFDDSDGAPFGAPVSARRFDDDIPNPTSQQSRTGAAGPQQRPSLVQRQHPRIEDDDDPEFQAIQHETISSERTSELSGTAHNLDSRNRSGSLNIEHNHDNIDENDDDYQSQEEEEDCGASQNQAAAQKGESFEESAEKVVDNDDWNFDDADDREEIEEDKSEEEQYKSSSQSKSDEQKKRQSEVVADWIVEQEIYKCIQTAMGLKGRKL